MGQIAVGFDSYFGLLFLKMNINQSFEPKILNLGNVISVRPPFVMNRSDAQVISGGNL